MVKSLQSYSYKNGQNHVKNVDHGVTCKLDQSIMETSNATWWSAIRLSDMGTFHDQNYTVQQK